MKLRPYLRLAIVVCVIGWPLFVTQFANAQFFELPAEIQQKFDSGDFTGLIHIPNSNPDVLRFDYLDESNQAKAIFRYRLGEGSAYTSSSGVFEEREGYAWVDVRRNYTTAGGTGNFPVHVADLYWEQIPGFSFALSSPIRLRFSDAALLAGTGSQYFENDVNGTDSGLSVQDAFVCLAEQCYFGAEVNLLGMNYSHVGNELVLGEGLSPISDSLLLEQQTGDLSGYIRSTLVVEFAPSLLACDVNLDGAVNFLDIAPFITFLTSGIYSAEADCNFDGAVNFLDIAPFTAILAGG